MFEWVNTDVTAQIFFFAVQLTILGRSFSKSWIAIAESQNKVIFWTKYLAGNVSPMIFFGLSETNYSDSPVDTNFN